ncbi:hypothetical protein L7F22_063888 [Adiantum nelumboides]|nr:hypothetical protein [Adiantum nelumboides]
MMHGEQLAIVLLDFEKAYDCVDWGSLEETMLQMSFLKSWICAIAGFHYATHSQSTFFASFMCFDVLPLVPPGPSDRRNSEDKDEEEENGSGASPKPSEKDTAELEALDQALEELLDGTQANFYAVVEWAYHVDPLRCISMQGATERFLSSQKADAAGFVRRLLVDLQSRITACFNRYVNEACHQTEKHDRNVRQTGVLTYIPRFADLAQRMENLVGSNSREMVDAAYTKLGDMGFRHYGSSQAPMTSGIGDPARQTEQVSQPTFIPQVQPHPTYSHHMQSTQSDTCEGFAWAHCHGCVTRRPEHDRAVVIPSAVHQVAAPLTGTQFVVTTAQPIDLMA